jgi:hypothetical protein
MHSEKNDDETVKEEFCTACAAIPIAMLGAGMSTAGKNKFNKNYRKYKKLNLIFSLTLTIVPFFIGIYFLFIKKDCNQCIAE